MKKIIVVGLAALSLSACNPTKESDQTSKTAETQAHTSQDIGTTDISDVKTEDVQYAEQLQEVTQSSDEPPVELRLSQQFDEHAAKMGNGNYLQLDLSAIVDEVKIYDVIVNRGNSCGPRFWYRNWQGHGPLKFGQGVRAHITCDFHRVKEVVVETDFGPYTFNF